MTDTPYQRLATLTPTTAYLDDVSIEEYLWESLYDHANQTPPQPDTIAEITHLWAVCRDGYADLDLALLARLTDGQWATCVAWSDTSGFDCRGDVDWHTADTREAAISQGLDKEARAHLGLSLPGEGEQQ